MSIDLGAPERLKGKTFEVGGRQPMICGQSEAVRFIYRKVPCKMGKRGEHGAVWLYPVNHEAPGENVYFHDPTDRNSQGFGGAILKFELENGTVYEAKGPWHGNTDSMLSDTGVDLKATHRTRGCVARQRVTFKGEWYRTRYEELLHADLEGPVLGKFERVNELAKEWATYLGEPVWYYSESRGGSSSGAEYPEGKGSKDFPEWWKAHQREEGPATVAVTVSGPALQQLNDGLAKECYGYNVEDAQKTGKCLQCREPALPKCRTVAGRREFGISGLCEVCFDSLFLE